MRSPRGQTPEVWFCAKCQGAPGAPAQSASQISSASNSTVTNKSTGFSVSRSSTPLTEAENDEEDDEDFELPPESEESRRRREQSDRASAEIGTRLLRGWAMLGDECPNDTCFGIPLVRPPNKQDGEKDPRKVCALTHLPSNSPDCFWLQECVICGNVYLPQGARSTAPAQPPPEPSPRVATVTAPPERPQPVQQPNLYASPTPAKETVRFISLITSSLALISVHRRLFKVCLRRRFLRLTIISCLRRDPVLCSL